MGMIKKDRMLSEIATARINRLVDIAKERVGKTGNTDELSRRYIGMAKSIRSHYEIKAPGLNRMVCKNCGSVIMPGLNASVRLSSRHGYMVVVCDKCGTEKHSFYK